MQAGQTPILTSSCNGYLLWYDVPIAGNGETDGETEEEVVYPVEHGHDGAGLHERYRVVNTRVDFFTRSH